MAPRTKKIEPEAQNGATDAELPPIAPYGLEPITEDIQSNLNIWGNSTQLAINKLQEAAPEWAKMLDDMFSIVRAAIQERM